MASSLLKLLPRAVSITLSLVLAGAALTVVGPPAPAQAAPGPVAGTPVVVPTSITDKIAPSHPYILATATDWTRVKATSTTDPKAIPARAKVIAVADSIIPLPPQPYKFQDARRILDAAIAVKDRVYRLGAAYQLTGDVKYAKRGYEEMASAASWPDWNPSHFLDTSEVTNGLGVGYDWFYNYMTPAQRTTILNALVEKGLKPGLANYQRNATSSFAVDVSNWNNVCNGGMIVGALSVAKENKALAEEILQAAVPSSVLGFQQWGPDGGYSEGIGYWGYAMQYTAVTLAALTSATGSDFGLSKMPGFSTAGNFPIYMGQAGVRESFFNYGDEYPGQGIAVENLYLGKLFNNPIYTGRGQSIMPSTSDPKALLWYDPAFTTKTPVEAALPEDGYFRNSETVLMRSAWDNPQSTFVGVKASSVRHGHADLDLGDFVFSALGESWATELGRDDYNFPGYFEDNKGRWDFYRKRAEGQNTMVFNMEQKLKGPDSSPAGTATFQKFFTSPGESSAVADLTKASPNDVKSWKRGVSLFDNKTQLLIQDEVQGQDSLKSSWWFMNTPAAIDVAADGRSAVLTKERDGVQTKVLARIVSSNTALTFTSMASQALPTSPNAPQETLTSSRKLAINITSAKDFTLGVQLTPLAVPGVVPPMTTLKALDTWATGKGTAPAVAGIKLNGVPLTGFVPTTRSYDVMAYSSTVPVVTADKAKSTDTIAVTQAPTSPGRATVTVKSGTQTSTYYVTFRNGDMPIVAATESGHSGPDVVANSIDGNPSTRWSVYGKAGGWAQYDLGSIKQVPAMAISLGNSKAVYFTYDVATSTDGKTWTPLVPSHAITVPTIIETHAVNRQARFIRVAVVGGEADPWVAIKDVRFFSPPQASAAPTYLSSVTLTAPKPQVKVGESMKLSLAAFTQAQAPFALTASSKVTYSSLNSSVASVDATGTVKGLTGGSSKVTAWVTDGLGRTTTWGSTVVQVDDPFRKFVPASADTWVNGGVNIDRGFGTSSPLNQKDVGVAGDTDRAAFMNFVVPPTPAGLKIADAKLTFTAQVKDGNGTALTLNVHPAAAPISETTTTWRNKPVLGAAIGSTPVDSTEALRSVSIAAYMAQTMPAGGKTLPIGFSQSLTTSKVALNTLIFSREAGPLAPVLDITYVSAATVLPAPPVTLLPVADTYVQGGAYRTKVLDGNATRMAQKDVGVAGDSDRAVFMQYTLPATPAGYKISSAQLAFTAQVDDGGGKDLKLNAHEVSGAINELTLTWNNKPALGGKVATVAVNSTKGVKTMDITAYAQKRSSAAQSMLSLGFSQTLTTSAKGLNTLINSSENTAPPKLTITYQLIK